MISRAATHSRSDPFDWPAALDFLGRRAIGGVEEVARGGYTRSVRVDGAAGAMALTLDLDRQLRLSMSGGGLPADDVAARVRWMFDLDADLDVINAHLAASDPWMATLVAARPAIRVFHGWSGFEVAIRTIIGQQVSVARARVLNGILVERCGDAIEAPVGPVSRLFPTPQQVLDADLAGLGMPGARVAALQAVAQAAIDDPRLFERGRTVEETTHRLRSVKGIGDWTAHYIAMRACGEPDAFPASDVGLLRGATGPDGRRPTARELLARAEAWRPWRAYAAHHLWAVDPW